MPIGRPIANTAHLRAGPLRGEPVPVGVPGELYIGGVRRGARLPGPAGADRRALRARSRLGGEPGARLYRTGDLARRLPDGEVEFLGRLDHQVKIRGFRIELGEIEAALAAQPGVREAVVVAREDRGRRRRAWSPTWCPERRRAGRRHGLRASARAAACRSTWCRRPSWCWQTLPLPPNGKVDRRALPEPDGGRRAPAGVQVAPRTPVETAAGRHLGRGAGGRAGGASTTTSSPWAATRSCATQVVVAAARRFGVELPVRAVFEHQTLAGPRRRRSRTGRLRTREAERDAAPRRPEEAARLRPARARQWKTSTELRPFAQERLWFLDQLEPGSAAYNMPAALRLCGPARRRGARRRPSTRWCAATRRCAPPSRSATAGPCQVIASGRRRRLCRWSTCAGCRPRASERGGPRAWPTSEAARPFDLARGPLLRTLLLRLATEASTSLLLTMHHIVSDGWSMGVLIRELAALYRPRRPGRPSPLPPLPSSTPTTPSGSAAGSRARCWQRELGVLARAARRAPAAASCRPTGRARRLQSFRGGDSAGRTCARTLLAGLRALARAAAGDALHGPAGRLRRPCSRATPAQETWSSAPRSPAARRARDRGADRLLHQHPGAARPPRRASPTSASLLARVRGTALRGLRPPGRAVRELVAGLEPERNLSRTPLFQVLLVLQNAPTATLRLPG